MEKKRIEIKGIPSIIWGVPSDKVIIAVHGNMSNKEDIPIEILANVAVSKNYQVLSFDLPEHGDRKGEETLCKVKECISDLVVIMKYVKDNWDEVSLFANSIGAYFSLLAYQDEQIKNAWFLSPVINMQRIIENMMKWFQIPELQLQQEQAIATPIGQTLYWDYYCYVKENPLTKWNVQTYILYGDKDEMCEKDTVFDFVDKYNSKLQIVENCEHYFCDEYQLNEFEIWLSQYI
ncbi:MAG: alpha/beta hydrolase [Coprobacillus sp.]